MPIRWTVNARNLLLLANFARHVQNGKARMAVRRLAGGPGGFEFRTFNGAKCNGAERGHAQVVNVAAGPAKSDLTAGDPKLPQ